MTLDPDEERAMDMLDDLAATDAVPESIKLLNAAAIQAIADGALAPGPPTSLLLNSDRPERNALGSRSPIIFP